MNRFAQGKTWKDYAACRADDGGMNHLFFPNLSSDEEVEAEAARQQIETALDICRTCMVKDDCREYALGMKSNPPGIWGGLTSRQLSAMRRTRQRDRLIREGVAPQGRPLSYRPGGCPCGAPSIPEPTQKYLKRHTQGVAGCPVSMPCEEARESDRMSKRVAHLRRNEAP